MKIERISENQIRCMVSKEDLLSRQMKLSELAYGSEKARQLFKEMMEQASYELGFDAEDMPLIVEAVPISSESLILLVSKVESPEELDTRFSQFSEGDDDDDTYIDDIQERRAPSFNNASANDVLDLINKLFSDQTKADVPEKDAKKVDVDATAINITKMYTFDRLDEVISLAKVIGSFYDAPNSLYKNALDGKYYLTVSKGTQSAEVFNKVCNILAEYGNQTNFVVGTENYIAEHYQVISKVTAIQTLAQI